MSFDMLLMIFMMNLEPNSIYDLLNIYIKVIEEKKEDMRKY